MKRVHVLVEGQTEEAFVRQVLRPHLEPRWVWVEPVVLTTKRSKSGRKFKGGVSSFERIRRDLRLLLADTDAARVTTMIDLYKLPDDAPGMEDLPSGGGRKRADHLEAAWRRSLDEHPRFDPYLSVHEFEALLLSNLQLLVPAVGETPAGGTRALDRLATAVEAAGTPEEVDDGESTHPAARLVELFPGYQKAVHGPLTLERAGLDVLRTRCPHFAAWLGRLESLAT